MRCDHVNSVAVIRNGVDIVTRQHGEQPIPGDLMLKRPITGVFGTLSSRLDLAMLGAVSDAGVSILLIGPASFRTDRCAFDTLRVRSNVFLVEPKDHVDLAR